MATRPPVPDDKDDWLFKAGAVVGGIIVLLVVVAMVLGIIWLAKQVF